MNYAYDTIEHDVFGNKAPRMKQSKGSEIVAFTASTPLFESVVKNRTLVGRNFLDGNSGELKVPQRFTKNGRHRAIPFPLKLMKVLSNKAYSHIITWMPYGKSFVIIRPTAFVNEILPEYFKSVQYSSFTRKLHRWGFTRQEDGTGEFYHNDFRKGRIDLAEKMTCQNIGSSSKSTTALKAQASSDSHIPTSLEKAQPATALVLLSEGRRTKAIELEALRLKNCIQAAAMSRHALADMQMQAARDLIALERQKLQLGLEAWRLALRASFQRGDDRGLGEFPRSNIRGAKMA